MNARIVGSGDTTLVLSHGYGGSQSMWDYVLPSLSQSNRVLLFDWSFSSAVDPSIEIFDSLKYSSLNDFADDLISLLDEMMMEGVVYVGHSVAAMVGCIASVRRPELFSHLVLIAASPRYLNTDDYKGGFEQKDIESMLSSIKSNFATWAKNFAPVAVGATNPEATEKFCASFLNMRPETALSVAKSIFLSDWREILGEVEIPCTIVQGDNDICVPVSVANYMKSKIKGEVMMVEIVEGDGHFPQLTSPKRLLDVIERVLVLIKLV
ncbi:uncharacterized protein A4U43_C03F30220 [Asparagus officinalis]|uniref:AB hydrolase-1 domain-containing protein n=1 Tax=Asparagus officinalis TaxID=4686 RepID=A0A5P1FIA1_ASPOF|nr:strigolactone esterase D14-like [Asparagus officinalis]ONK76619.1 uncharacterized protein A4U43_C03F30220 [Asparagus officinalis]